MKRKHILIGLGVLATGGTAAYFLLRKKTPPVQTVIPVAQPVAVAKPVAKPADNNIDKITPVSTSSLTQGIKPVTSIPVLLQQPAAVKPVISSGVPLPSSLSMQNYSPSIPSTSAIIKPASTQVPKPSYLPFESQNNNYYGGYLMGLPENMLLT